MKIKYLIILSGILTVFLISACGKKNHNSPANEKSEARETVVDENDPVGSWVFNDRSAMTEYRLNISPGGSYIMDDFGGSGMISGQWKMSGSSITLYDDTGMPWTRGSVSSGSISIRTAVGTITYHK